MNTEESAQDLLGSIVKVASDLVRGERASLMLRREAEDDFVVARARGLAEDVMRQVRVREGEGVAGHVAATMRPLLVRGGSVPLRGVGGGYRTDSFVSVPIIVGDRTQAIMNVTDRADGQPFEESDLHMLEVLAHHIAACLARQRLDEQLRELAETDSLTLLFNRRHFDRRTEAELARARRTLEPLALLMIDVNSFKQVNDRLGHPVGDDILRGVAAAIRRTVRAYDVPVRYGGDEFAVILPNAEVETARAVGERIVGAVAGFAMSNDIITAVPTVGLSVGVAGAPPADDVALLVQRADAALYEAKAMGGGVAIWEPRDLPAAVAPRRALSIGAPFLKDPGKLARTELQALIPHALAEEWNVLVIGQEGAVLTVAMPEPSAAAVEALSAATGRAIYPVYSAAADIEQARRALAPSS